jgi:hypothetical protein
VGLQSRKQGTHWRTPREAEALATDRDHPNGLESKKTVADAARLFDLHPSTVGQLLAASIQSESSSQDSGGCRREFFITKLKGETPSKAEFFSPQILPAYDRVAGDFGTGGMSNAMLWVKDYCIVLDL